MKILHVINNLNTGGAEKLLLDSIPKFIESNVHVELLLLNGKEYPFLKLLNVGEECRVHSLGKGAVYNPFLPFKIIRYFKQFDIVHVHLFPSLYWVAIAKVLAFSKIKLIYTEHSTSNNRRNKFIFNPIDKFIYRRYNKIITISKDVDSLLKKYLKMADSSFRIIPNGVDLLRIKKVAPYNRLEFASENERIVVQVSNFSKQKDQRTLIKAIPYLKNRVKLLLVGDGELIEECKALVSELELEDTVLFLGIRMDAISILKIADVAVLSTHYEGLSLSSIEALACEKPLIASRVPGLSTVVEGAGILFPEGDELILAETIDRLLSDEVFLKQTAGLCLKRAQDFDLDLMIKEHIKLYKEVCQDQN